jgi:hypothetical protein
MTRWLDLLAHTRELAPHDRDSVRLANLATAAQTAAAQGRLGRHRRLDGLALIAAVHKLALTPLAADEGALLTWRALADDARRVAATFASSSGTDAWVEAFQGADAARKSRGAYATPRALGAPMARLLLQGAPLPRRIVDPAAGAGGLLVAVLHELRRIDRDPDRLREHAYRLHGVELDPVARELCCMLIWLAAAGSGARLGSIAARVGVDNAITRDWWADDAYDALVMNPPWDSLRHGPAAAGGGELEHEATVARLTREQPGDPDLPALFSAQGRGDRNLYKAFAELAPHLVRPQGRLVVLLPGAWSSDLGTQQLRRRYLAQLDVKRWTSFENRYGHFPIDGRYKFGILTAIRDRAGTGTLPIRAFAADASELRRAHVRVSAAELLRLGGPAEIIPDLTSRAEAQLMLRYERHGTPLFDPDGVLGRVVYDREVDLTEDRKRGRFERLERLDAAPLGNGRWQGADGRTLVPLVEGRMVGPYEFHQKSWVAGSGRTAQWTYANGHRLRDCRPQFLVAPADERRQRIAICDVTSATNTRTVLATWVPPEWPCGNTAPVLVFEDERRALAALAILNSMVFDWLARRVVAGLHLNRFYLEALRWPTLGAADVDALAAAGAALQRFSPRYADLDAPAIELASPPLDYVDAHTLVEATVAAGYRLAAPALETVLDPTTTDRRGFWRHFASDPHARTIAERAVARLDPARAAVPISGRRARARRITSARAGAAAGPPTAA